MAMTIQEAIGGELFRIETTEEYPLEHETLVNQAKEEQNEDARPELATHIENVEQYDQIGGEICQEMIGLVFQEMM